MGRAAADRFASLTSSGRHSHSWLSAFRVWRVRFRGSHLQKLYDDGGFASGHGFTVCGKTRNPCRAGFQPRRKSSILFVGFSPWSTDLDFFRKMFNPAATIAKWMRLQPL